jgi:hypothetical protein
MTFTFFPSIHATPRSSRAMCVPGSTVIMLQA